MPPRDGRQAGDRLRNRQQPDGDAWIQAEADAIVAEFGVSRAAVLDVVFGGYNPTGRLPIHMLQDTDAVGKQSEDRALDMETYIDREGHNYDYGYGMNYEGVLPAWKK